MFVARVRTQGPTAAEALQPLVDVDLSKVYFSNFLKTNIKGVPSFLTRTGCGRQPPVLGSN